MAEQTTAIPRGSLVLITGLTGYIATHVAQEFLHQGYKVRGTVRDISKASWLTDDLFSAEHAAGKVELIQVPDLGAPHAFDDAIKGVAAIAHVATVSNLDPDPNQVIPQTVSGIVSLLRAAAAEPSVKRVVFTSSAGSAIMPIPGASGHVGRDTWNDAAVQAAWAPPPYDASRGMVTYMASKVEAEKAVWKFIQEEKPGFVTNVVSPFTTLGAMLHPSHARGTAGWVSALWKGDTTFAGLMPSSIYVNVKDVAVLHVAAVLDEDTKEERIQAWATPFNWNDVLAIFRRIDPSHKVVDDFPVPAAISTTADDEVPLKLLKKWAKQDGWKSLEDSIRQTLSSSS
ncbi:NAD dependent epimerase/dehydratase family domain-containing protein [Trichoderma breve]|uniref:NAD dependent epimerase/dehydratase family domain-containing protein n=1 Tax=Trichoderma breve TaxID=2034170 RepID=A0A9W9B5T8_9HYPO|nr:NAD dependent epimerase/dehydratase family domain-containing protein [Trichoderma breve]KAJ4854250.1 NAD dependent epimerase/dehydratase family domain-containing protein [Trichoderma breve]